ncbi:MAG TPA: hypothetical protein H9898_03655 [Candidatus Anaerobiospirillum stercoravium]|nr:hypothetical protein [Candidatus Anaerobiospirillum stercoravium]
MQTQLRLINAQLTPELAVGILPTRQHCLVTNAITVRGGKRPLTNTEILGLLGHKTDLVVSSNPVTAAGSKEQTALTTGAQSLAADVLPSANVLPAAPVTAAARAGHPGTGAACAARAALGRTAAQALDFTVTRLIFPLADYQLVAGAYHLLNLSWGHYAVLTGYAVAPTICYRRVHLPLLELNAPDPCVVREQVPALMVTSLAVAPDDCCYRPQQPILTFEQPAGALGSVAVEWAGASDCIVGTVWAPDHWTELHYGYSTGPQAVPLTASAAAAATAAAATAAGTQVPKVPIAHDLGVTRKELGALDAQLAQALRSQDGFAQASSPLLAPPTALPLNDALEPIFNPEPLAPAYRAFLARQRPCAAHDLYWARSALGFELGADFSAALRSAAAPVGARAAGDVTAPGAVDRSADRSGKQGAARMPRGVRLSA